MAVRLKNYQQEAIDKLKNGSVLCGGVGSGKSITAVGYYFFKVCKGDMKILDYEELPWDEDGEHTKIKEMEYPRDLYIITTAKKRDAEEWDEECSRFHIFKNDPKNSISNVKVTIDSWNNIKKYKDIFGAFFIFDEQRVVGSGSWVKSFLNIARKNKWILLSATPGDTWSDYIPLFIANGFYKNKTEFNNLHCVYARFSKYPKIERYVGESVLSKYRDSILVLMGDERKTKRNVIPVNVEYDKDLLNLVYRDRWDPYENKPIEESGKWVYLLRKVVNSDPSRIENVYDIFLKKHKCIVFYNFNYELDILRGLCKEKEIPYSEWNGQLHEEIPKTSEWLYLVQYSAGSEGWNCIETDTIIFYSQNYSYKITEQASGRIDRMNTPFIDLYYYKLKSYSFIDMMIYKSWKNKKSFNEALLRNQENW